MSRIASLAMYDMPLLEGANDALWDAVARPLRASGIEDVPARLERQRPLMDVWRDPDLLLAQTCGYPLMTALAGDVTPVAAPVYAWPGCSGVRHCSLIVVAKGAPFQTLADLRGSRVAMNGADSNSGMNLLRHAVAGLAEDGRFFGAVTVTGSHLASLDHVVRGAADFAAIDCVTFGLASRHRPALVAGVRVIGETAMSPALPFVTRSGASAEQVATLREALAAAIADPDAAEAVDALGLAGVEPVETSDYAVILDYEREAVAAGYPTLR